MSPRIRVFVYEGETKICGDMLDASFLALFHKGAQVEFSNLFERDKLPAKPGVYVVDQVRTTLQLTTHKTDINSNPIVDFVPLTVIVQVSYLGRAS